MVIMLLIVAKRRYLAEMYPQYIGPAARRWDDIPASVDMSYVLATIHRLTYIWNRRLDNAR